MRRLPSGLKKFFILFCWKYLDRRCIVCYDSTMNSRPPPGGGLKGVFGLSISSDTLRGHTDTIILTQLMQGDNYGYEINKTIQQRTGGQYGFKEATLYTAFKRLETGGFITSYWGEDGPSARRRYYSITEEGRRYCEESRTDWQKTRALLDALIFMEE